MWFQKCFCATFFDYFCEKRSDFVNVPEKVTLILCRINFTMPNEYIVSRQPRVRMIAIAIFKADCSYLSVDLPSQASSLFLNWDEVLDEMLCFRYRWSILVKRGYFIKQSSDFVNVPEKVTLILCLIDFILPNE